MIEFSFGCYHIQIELDPNGGGQITTNLKDDADADDTAYFDAIDGLESLVLAHACAGVAVSDPKYVKGIADAVEAIANNV